MRESHDSAQNSARKEHRLRCDQHELGAEIGRCGQNGGGHGVHWMAPLSAAGAAVVLVALSSAVARGGLARSRSMSLT